jgi:hypothetical protein
MHAYVYHFPSRDCARSMDVFMSHAELSTECRHTLSRISGIEGFALVRRREDLYLCATSDRKRYKRDCAVDRRHCACSSVVCYVAQVRRFLLHQGCDYFDIVVKHAIEVIVCRDACLEMIS